MTDTHAITTREFVVVERQLDCDGSCRGEGEALPTVFDWSGLPPRLRKLLVETDWPTHNPDAVRARVGVR